MSCSIWLFLAKQGKIDPKLRNYRLGEGNRPLQKRTHINSIQYRIAEGVDKLCLASISRSFDPVTNGHIDLLERSKLFDKIVVAVIHNVTKSALFSLDERVHLIRESAKHIKNVEVDCFYGLLADYLR